jgi:hydroxymethylpyrimidine/phosphomethylpyrimidine kinase
LLPLATLVTPNLDEAELLTGRKITSMDGLIRAAMEIHRRFGCAALVKGGHLRVMNDAVDVLQDREGTRMHGAPFVKGVSTHGTGCHYSAAITANLAHGLSLREAVEESKVFITGAISQSTLAAKHTVLNPFWED